jgi:hypothetical protein
MTGAETHLGTLPAARIECRETVRASVEAVWRRLVDLRSWPAWWDGSEPLRVEPAWQRGGRIVWKSGSPSTIDAIAPYGNDRHLEFSGESMGCRVRRALRLTSQDVDAGQGRIFAMEGQETLSGARVVYEMAVEGASFASGAEERERTDMGAALARLKALVEREEGTDVEVVEVPEVLVSAPFTSRRRMEITGRAVRFGDLDVTGAFRVWRELPYSTITALEVGPERWVVTHAGGRVKVGGIDEPHALAIFTERLRAANPGALVSTARATASEKLGSMLIGAMLLVLAAGAALFAGFAVMNFRQNPGAAVVFLLVSLPVFVGLIAKGIPRVLAPWRRSPPPPRPGRG